jgi:hypothetical protein
MAKIYDLVVKVGERKDGSPMNRTIGCILDDGMGPYMLLERWLNPAGIPGDKQAIRIKMMEPRMEREESCESAT